MIAMLSLIPFVPVHFPTLAGWFASREDVVQWGGTAVAYPLDDRQLQAMLDGSHGDPPARLCWMAEREGTLVGHLQLAFEWPDGAARLGRVVVAPEARGLGLARPMVALAIARAFAHPEIERLELYVYPWNTPALKTYERLGFVYEGTRRSSAKVGDQRWDTGIMGMLRAEWRPDAV
jgi:RimJ/RimL family protein N-acetyltransferase